MAEKEMSKEERIAYSQGALNTLIGERNELIKLLKITEQLLQAHVQELQKLGVKFQSQSLSAESETKAKKKK